MQAPRPDFGGSSSGRTADSDSVNLGSNPSPPATPRQTHAPAAPASHRISSDKSPACPSPEPYSRCCTPGATPPRCSVHIVDFKRALGVLRVSGGIRCGDLSVMFRPPDEESLGTPLERGGRVPPSIDAKVVVEKHLFAERPDRQTDHNTPASHLVDAKKQHFIHVCLFLPHSVAKHSALHYSSVRKA